MNGGLQSRGYTIVEVLIFMAVSGLMFVMAIVFVNGKQSSVEFKQGLYDANSDIKTTINEVANGRFDSLAFGPGAVKCTASAFGGPPSFSAGSVEQGANGGSTGCTFLGKVIQLNVADFGTQAQNYESIYTVAGRQLNTSGQPVTSFVTASPAAITTPRDLTRSKRLQSGLEVTGSYLCNNAACSSKLSAGAIGFFGSFNSALGSTSGSGQSGAQSVIAVVVPGSTYGSSRAATVSAIAGTLAAVNATNTIGAGKYALLCFKNGTKTGAVYIGGINGQQFTTQVKVGIIAGC